jgi:DNA helicase-2/ATP-dependent DNA helicase PcrA
MSLYNKTELNEYQRDAASFEGKHLLVLAGAGTGKTKTIVARAEHLLNAGVNPKKLAILSFTRKSAKEIADRLKVSVSPNVNKSAITGKTFHSWCNEIMHYYPDQFPHHSYTPLDEDDRESAVALVIGKNFRDSMEEKVKKETIIAIYSYAVNTLCSLSDAIYHIRFYSSDRNDPEIVKRIEADKILFAPVIKKYIDYKKERKYIDYDDMLNVVASALAGSEELRKHVSDRYAYILVDEMQDTNPLQYKLLNSFVEYSKLFCVGDDAQSIYSFRGADFKTIHGFTEIFPNSEKRKLELNYRSTQEILDLSNWLLEQSPLAYDKKLIAHRGTGEKPNVIHVADDWEEADLITDDILKTTAEGSKFSDSLVVGRSIWSLSKVEGACLTKKIPYLKYGGTSLMQSAHVRDVVSAMRIATNIYDEIAWIRYLQLWEGIGEVFASRIINEIISLDSLEKMIAQLERSNIKNLKAEISGTLKKVKELLNNPAEAMMAALSQMEETLYGKYKDEWMHRMNDFDVLKEVAMTTTSITEFITEYVLDPKVETTIKQGREINTDAVILSTIHSAKGLEANFVHVINVNPNGYPSSRSIKQGEDAVEEERRCLYVALTRAKDRLNLYRFTRSIQVQQSDGTDEASKLYFLNNIPPELVNIQVPGVLDKDKPKPNLGVQTEADFPDFDFG